jgi:hypothetical protein
MWRLPRPASREARHRDPARRGRASHSSGPTRSSPQLDCAACGGVRGRHALPCALADLGAFVVGPFGQAAERLLRGAGYRGPGAWLEYDVELLPLLGGERPRRRLAWVPLSELDLPDEGLVALVRRHDTSVAPDGTSALELGDRATFTGRAGAIENLRNRYGQAQV